MNKNLSPRHLQLRAMLFRRWKTSGLNSGDKIESQNEIIRFCDFSLITVIKTLKDLEAEGIIRRQVGRGSFLVKTPWAEAHRKIGFFYNRDVVGGGIFNNDFYTRLVTEFEKGIVSAGHEFILGSFTHNRMPVDIWDALDAVIVTGISDETRLEQLGETSSQVSLFDLEMDELPFHSYRLDFGPSFDEMFRYFSGQNLKCLYLDTQVVSPEQADRRQAFINAQERFGAQTQLKIISVNQETDIANTASLETALKGFQPDIVCGYMHHSWQEMVAALAAQGARVYGFSLDPKQSGFVVETADWMRQILPRIYHNLDDRQAGPRRHRYPARFQP